MRFTDLLRNPIEDIIRNISGPAGYRLRYWYYRRRMRSMGKSVTIDTGVFFVNTGYISIGEHSWIDKNCTIIAGTVSSGNISGERTLSEEKDGIGPGEVKIGRYAHIGIGAILQGHGGILIGDYFTTSAHCRLYSLSNDYKKSRFGTMDIHDTGYEASYYSKKIVIGKNVWLGLNVSLISATVGDDVFVKPHSVVSGDLDANTIAEGNPAVPVKKRFEQ